MSNSATVSIKVRIHTSVGAFFSNMIEFYDLMILSMALALISKEFNLSLAEAGMLGTATLIGCGISAFIIGWCSENFGRKPTLFYSVLIFSVLTAGIGVASGYLQILVLRLLAGITLGGIFTLVGTLMNETWPAHLRGKATTIVWISSSCGVILASFLVANMMPKYGWRSLFIFALTGIIVAIYIAIFVPETEAWKAMKAQKKEKIPLSVGLKEIFSSKLRKNTLLGTGAAFLAGLSFWGFMYWLPTFLIAERGLAPAAVGGYIAFQSIGQIIGVPLSGVIADAIGRKKTLILIFILGGILIPLYVSSHNLQVLFWGGPFIAAIFSYPGLMATYYPEFYPTHVRSLGVGFLFNIGRALSAIGPYTLGALAATYSLQTSIVVCGILYVLGAILIFFLPETFRKKDLTNNNAAVS